jgi:acylphosphatase
MKRRVQFRVTGRVQGVAFRATAQDEAERLEVRGWVRNTTGGQVVGVAEGEATAVDAFVAWCGHGPPGARVELCQTVDEEYVGDLKRFEIRR